MVYILYTFIVLFLISICYMFNLNLIYNTISIYLKKINIGIQYKNKIYTTRGVIPFSCAPRLPGLPKLTRFTIKGNIINVGNQRIKIYQNYTFTVLKPVKINYISGTLPVIEPNERILVCKCERKNGLKKYVEKGVYNNTNLIITEFLHPNLN